MTTVLTVPGIFAPLGRLIGRPDVMGSFYQHQCTTVGETLPTRVADEWPDVTQVIDTSHTATSIARALRTLPPDEHVLVMAHSRGSLAVLVYLKRFAGAGERIADRTVFLISGADINMVQDDYVVESPYPVIDVVLQWEKYSDPPTVRTSKFYARAVDNINRLNLHTTGYQNLSLVAEPDRENTDGAVTYLFYETLQNPVGATRAEIETAYERLYLGDPGS